jgi:hypothetical protein
MAFANRLSERMEELRFPSVRSPNEEASYNTYTSPQRADSSFFSTFQQPSADSRGSLQRRFTTDSSKVSSAFGQGYNSLNTSSVCHKSFFTHAWLYTLFSVGAIEDRRSGSTAASRTVKSLVDFDSSRSTRLRDSIDLCFHRSMASRSRW